MKIAIEAQRLFRKKKHGMEIVALEIITELQQVNSRDEFFVLAKGGEDEECISATQHFTIEKITSKPYPSWEQISQPKI